MEGSISLLHSVENDQEALSLSVEVKVASYPVSLVVLAELRDKHGIRPSADDVSKKGQAFEITSSEVAVLSVLLFMALLCSINRAFRGIGFCGWFFALQTSTACRMSSASFTWRPEGNDLIGDC